MGVLRAFGAVILAHSESSFPRRRESRLDEPPQRLQLGANNAEGIICAFAGATFTG